MVQKSWKVGDAIDNLHIEAHILFNLLAQGILIDD